MAVGGAALALTPQGRGIVSDLFGDGDQVDVTADQLNAAISDTPAGQQPSTVRTYTEQNESYMGSRAGNELRKNTPKTGQLYASPSAAAANTKVTVKTVLAKDPIRHLASRTTFGTNTKTIADIKRMGIDRWLRWQLEPDKIAPTPAELKLAEHATYKLTIKQLREQREALNEKDAHADQEVIETTIARQIWSDRQLFEVMVDFWNDFLHVGRVLRRRRDDPGLVRPGRDPQARAGQLRRHARRGQPAPGPAGLPEPEPVHARTGSTRTSPGRTSSSTRSASTAATPSGTSGRPRCCRPAASVRDDEYVYRPEAHYVGPVKIMGFKHANSSAEGGEAAAEAYFRYLALHPSTARYIAINLATRFVSDTPPKTLVDRLAKSYTTNKGRIKPVLMTLFSSSEFWAVGRPEGPPADGVPDRHLPHAGRPAGHAGRATSRTTRTRTPVHCRDCGRSATRWRSSGHFPIGMPTPNGYPDIFVAWTSAGTMINGWNEANDIIHGDRRMFTYTAPEQLARRQAAGHRRRVRRRAVQEAGAPDAHRQGEDPAARRRRGRRRRAGRRDVQRRRRRRRARPARIPAAPPPVRPNGEEVPMSDHPKFAVHPDCPDVRRLADNRFEAMLRAEADAVEAENLAERDQLRMLNDLEEQQQDGRGVTRRTFVVGAAATSPRRWRRPSSSRPGPRSRPRRPAR